MLYVAEEIILLISNVKRLAAKSKLPEDTQSNPSTTVYFC
jgi:hypothetical protein